MESNLTRKGGQGSRIKDIQEPCSINNFRVSDPDFGPDSNPGFFVHEEIRVLYIMGLISNSCFQFKSFVFTEEEKIIFQVEYFFYTKI